MKIFALGFLFSLTTLSAASEGESVPIHLGDGVTLSGTYYGATSPGPGLLFLNMCDPERDQTEWTSVAMDLSAAGYHVLTFDYRGFGASGGEMPQNLDTIEKAMPYWRENWMGDVQAAYEVLASQDGVQTASMGIAGASCGVFMGLEFTLAHENIRSFASLGGPTMLDQRNLLRKNTDLPVLIIAGNEGPIHEWSDQLFSATLHPDSRMIKYNVVTYGTKIFGYERATQNMVVEWFRSTISLK
jgi:predicted alpha/beta hydrolase